MSDPTTAVPRMTDIAKRAGVSRAAVSAVLMGTGQGRIRVGQETAGRIRQIAAELGYRPNQAARQLAGQRSGVIGIVANHWGNLLTQRALAWMHAAAETHDLRVLAVYAHASMDPVHRLMRELRSGWIDGLVYLAHENESQWPEVAKLFEGVNNAVVAVGNIHAAGVGSLICDVDGAARESIQHCFERGKRRPVLVTEEVESAFMQTRIAAYRAAAAERGMFFDDSSIVIDTRGWGIDNPAFYPQFDELARRLRHQLQADAVLCDSDFTAAGILRAFRRLGFQIPDDVAVIGWGDLQFAGMYEPTITTVSFNLTELLSRVVDRLLRSKQPNPAADSSSKVELVPMKLLLREST